MKNQVTSIKPGTFEATQHWYPKALNATIHPMVNFFLNLEKDRIIERYCHLRPMVNREKLNDILSYQCKYFLWGGADLINSTSAEGKRSMVVIENNSCPSGQKSMPLLDDNKEEGSYKLLIERTFKPIIKKRVAQNRVRGKLAVIYDKNIMEASGYASIIADVFQEEVLLVPFYNDRSNDHYEFNDGVLYVKESDTLVSPVRAAFRYVTQQPWDRIPIKTRTVIVNPIIACLAGGRNKMVAAKAYDIYNTELSQYGLRINTPQTFWDVSKEEIPLWVKKLGGQAVVKIPYSNAGQGVFTIINNDELDAFMQKDFEYKQFIVQSLIGNYNWSSTSERGRYYHVGMIPNQKKQTFINDLRLMVSSTAAGIRPLCTYARRAAQPLAHDITSGDDSWAMLGTNLSVKLGENKWNSDTTRLMLMDRRDFNKLGLGLDDLIEAFIQTTLSMIAIDQMCVQLMNSKNQFRMRLFKSLNADQTLLDQIIR